MRRNHVLLAILLVVGAFVVWRWHGFPEKTAAAPPPSSSPASNRIAGAVAASGETTPPGESTPIAPSPTSPDLPAPMSSGEIARVVAAYSQPGRMVFVELAISTRGIAAVRAIGATGRAKPGPVQRGVGHLQYEVFSPTGERTLTGSAPDPLHERLEYEDEQQPGKIRAIVVDRSEGLLNLRLPGEADAARLVFFREVASASAGGTTRESAGEIVLR